MTRSWHYRLVVEPIACDGYGYCAELLPEMVTVDEWGFPMVERSNVPPALLDLARRAVADCPRRALQLVADKPESRPQAQSRVVLATTRR